MSGIVRLSRDTQLPNRTIVEFERGWARCKAATADQLEVGFAGASFALGGQLASFDTNDPRGRRARRALSYHQSFCKQLKNVVAAVRGDEPLFIPGNEGILSLRLVEQCYRHRRLVPMPWLSEVESKRALSLSTNNCE